MKRILWLSAPLLLILITCVSNPASVDTPIVDTPIADEGVPADEAVPETDDILLPDEDSVEEEFFDPSTITIEVYNTTKTEVQDLIEKLNLIIRSRDYEAWVSFLSEKYRAKLSAKNFLDKISSSPVLVKQKIELKTLEDYFLHVVVPSRANDRVDDIEFIGQNKVKAFTLSAKGVRLRLYELEKNGDGWMIAN